MRRGKRSAGSWISLAGLAVFLGPGSADAALEPGHLTVPRGPDPGTTSLEPAVQVLQWSAERPDPWNSGAAGRYDAAQMASRVPSCDSLMPWPGDVHSRRENGHGKEQMLHGLLHVSQAAEIREILELPVVRVPCRWRPVRGRDGGRCRGPSTHSAAEKRSPLQRFSCSGVCCPAG